MGIFAEGSVNIYFEKEEDANKVHEILSSKEVEEEIIKILGEEKGKGHYCFYDFCDNGTQSVDFMLSSGRIQNAEWQGEQIFKLLKQMVKSGEIEGVEEMSCSMMMETDRFYFSGDEFEEGGEDE
jgi:hypothetical protein